MYINAPILRETAQNGYDRWLTVTLNFSINTHKSTVRATLSSVGNEVKHSKQPNFPSTHNQRDFKLSIESLGAFQQKVTYEDFSNQKQQQKTFPLEATK